LYEREQVMELFSEWPELYRDSCVCVCVKREREREGEKKSPFSDLENQQ